MRNLKVMLMALDEADRKANAAWEALEADWDNEQLGAVADELCDQARHLAEQICDELIRFTDGKIDRNTAMMMVHGNRQKLMSIAEKI